MQNIAWNYLYPEIWMLSMTLFILLIGLVGFKQVKPTVYFLTQVTVIGMAILSFEVLEAEPTAYFHDMFVADPMSAFLKIALGLFAFFIFFYSKEYVFGAKNYRYEYFVLCLFSILGMMVLVSARHFLSMYLGIEILALPLYALITLVREDKAAPEAAMKYFLVGGLSSGMLLYGISLIYGMTGSFDMQEVATELTFLPETNLAVILGCLFILVGVAFKFGAVPFHMWLPDVYQGAPISVTLFLGTLPKIAAFGFAIRLLWEAFPHLTEYWQQLFMWMGIFSLLLGNFAAVAQTNLKRLLAYSTIAHVGFIFFAFIGLSELALAAALDYVLVYALMAMGAFGVMTLLSNQDLEIENIDDLKGLVRRSPWLAGLMMIMLLSLAGIPPFAGFYAKFFVLDALITAGHLELAVFAVVMTVIAAFYYLKVIRVMFFPKVISAKSSHGVSSLDFSMLFMNGLLVLGLGLFPGALFDLCLGIMVSP